MRACKFAAGARRIKLTRVPRRATEAAMANVKLRVTGMSCGHCQLTVEQALKGVKGVYTAIVDLTDGEAEVDFNDDEVTPAQLVAAVERAGYGARLGG
jgi:copper chaperone CopZ